MLRSYQFVTSVQEDVDDAVVPDGVLSRIENGVFEKVGAIRKCNGWAADGMNVLTGLAPYGPGFGAIHGLFANDDELVALDDQFLWKKSNSFDAWAGKDEFVSHTVRRLGFPVAPAYDDSDRPLIRDCDCVWIDTRIFVVYILGDASVGGGSDYSLLLAVFDTTTGEYVYTDIQLVTDADFHNPRIIEGASKEAVVVVYNGTANQHEFYRIPYATPTSPTGPTAIAATTADSAYSLAGTKGDLFYFAHWTTSTLCVLYSVVVSTGVKPSTTTVTGIALHHSTDMDWDGGTLHFAYYSPGVNVTYVNYSGTLVPNGTLVANSAALTMATPLRGRIAVKYHAAQDKAIVFWMDNINSGSASSIQSDVLFYRGADCSTYTAIGSTHRHIPWVWPTAKAFVSGNRIHLPIVGNIPDLGISGLGFSSGSGPAHAGFYYADTAAIVGFDMDTLARDMHPYISSVFAVDEGVIGVEVPGIHSDPLPNATLDPASRYLIFTHRLDKRTSAKQDIVQVDLADPWRYLPASGRDGVLIGGGAPSWYDGERAGGMGSLFRPHICEMVPGAGTGSLTALGAYQYQIVAEWNLANGSVVRSGIGPEGDLSVTLGAGDNEVEIWMRGPMLSNLDRRWPWDKRQGRLLLCRTLANTTEPVYRVAKVLRINNTATDYYVYTDGLSDTDLQKQPLLYTNGELEDTPLPSCAIVETIGQRVMAASDEFPGRIYFSKPFTPGQAVAFNVNFAYIEACPGERPTGIGDLDGRAVVLTRDAVYFIDGVGPDANLRPANTFSVRRIAQGRGCIDPRSVVSTPVGVMWRGIDTFMLLDRSLSVNPIGRAADRMATDYANVIGVTVDRGLSAVRWTCLAADGSTGIIVYYWEAKAWVLETPTPSSANDTTASAVVNDVQVLAAGDTVYARSGWTNPDSTWFPLVLETGWFDPGNIEGFQRVWRVMFKLRKKGSHVLKLSVGYDGAATWARTYTIAQATIDSFTDLMDIPRHLGLQKCSRIRFRLEDDITQRVGTGQSYEALGLTLEFGVQPTIIKAYRAKGS